MKRILLFNIMLLSSLLSLAQYGTLDNTFGEAGKVTSQKSFTSNATATRADGGVIAAGTGVLPDAKTTGAALCAFKVDGSIDSSFGTDGRVVADLPGYESEVFNDIAILPDGRIQTVGTAYGITTDLFATLLTRHLLNGNFDSSFGINGIVIMNQTFEDILSPNTVILQLDNKIVVAGPAYHYTIFPDFRSYSFIMRFKPDGSFDESFGTDKGKTLIEQEDGCDIKGIALQEDGKIVVCGANHLTVDGRTHFLLQRYNPSGMPDPSFGDGGQADYTYQDQKDEAHSVHILPDGKIVAAGGVNFYTSASLAVVCVNGDGTTDKTFGENGWAVAALNKNETAYGGYIALQKDGSPVIGGTLEKDGVQNFVLTGFTPGGKPDSSFGTDGITQTSFAHLISPSNHSQLLM